jgi:hypothetical protein
MMVDIGGGGHVSHLRTRIRVEAARRRALAPTRPNGCGMEREETGPHFGIRRFPRGRHGLLSVNQPGGYVNRGRVSGCHSGMDDFWWKIFRHPVDRWPL